MASSSSTPTALEAARAELEEKGVRAKKIAGMIVAKEAALEARKRDRAGKGSHWSNAGPSPLKVRRPETDGALGALGCADTRALRRSSQLGANGVAPRADEALGHTAAAKHRRTSLLFP